MVGVALDSFPCSSVSPEDRPPLATWPRGSFRNVNWSLPLSCPNPDFCWSSKNSKCTSAYRAPWDLALPTWLSPSAPVGLRLELPSPCPSSAGHSCVGPSLPPAPAPRGRSPQQASVYGSPPQKICSLLSPQCSARAGCPVRLHGTSHSLAGGLKADCSLDLDCATSMEQGRLE